MQIYDDVEALAGEIGHGASLALPPDYAGPPMSVVRALIRRAPAGLRLIGVPQLGLPADLLIGAGCVASVETAAVTLGEHGLAPRFSAAVKSGAVRIIDSTCPALHAGLQAAEKGLPFMPLRGLIGSDVLAHRPDWRVIDNPFGDDDPIVVLPAIVPDVALVHAPLADAAGNVWIGVRRELMLMAHAARTTLVTVEAFADFDLLGDERYAAGTIPSLYVCGIAEAPRGAHPLGIRGGYGCDDAHLGEYVRAASTPEGFAAYLEAHVRAPLASAS